MGPYLLHAMRIIRLDRSDLMTDRWTLVLPYLAHQVAKALVGLNLTSLGKWQHVHLCCNFRFSMWERSVCCGWTRRDRDRDRAGRGEGGWANAGTERWCGRGTISGTASIIFVPVRRFQRQHSPHPHPPPTTHPHLRLYLFPGSLCTVPVNTCGTVSQRHSITSLLQS